jgi:propionyl-CoA synthetase
MGRYAQEFSRSMADRSGFWGEAAGLVDWYAEPAKVLDDSAPPFYRWFTGGTLNTCYNAIDRHVAAGRGAQAALIYDSPVTGTTRVFSYAELLDQVALVRRCAARSGSE